MPEQDEMQAKRKPEAAIHRPEIPCVCILLL